MRTSMQSGAITVWHGSAYTVVRATQQVNGKWQYFGKSELRNP